MKVNRDKMLKTVSSNNKVVISVLVFVCVFSILVVPFINKGTHSTDVELGVISLSCPDSISKNLENLECELVLNSSKVLKAISVNYSIDNTSMFTNPTVSHGTELELYYSGNDGFTLISNTGISGSNKVLGKITYSVSDSIVALEEYSVKLSNIQIGYDDLSEEKIDYLTSNIDVVDILPPVEEETSDVNTLSSITINNGEVLLSPSFSKDVFSYTAITELEKVTIDATKNDEKATVSGLGEKELVIGNNEVKISVTSESGKVLEYVINITREEGYSLSFADSLSNNVDNELKVIKYLSIGTTVFNLKNQIDVKQGEVNLYNSNNVLKSNDSVLATGDIVKIVSKGQLKAEYTISVLGDSSGDGIVDLIDLVQIRKHISGFIDPNSGAVYSKSGVYYYALDLSKDGIVDLVDVVRMRKINAGVE